MKLTQGSAVALQWHQDEIRHQGWTRISDAEAGFAHFYELVEAAFFNEEILPPVPDAYGPVATRYRNKAIVHYRWRDDGQVELKEISDAKYAIIGTGPEARTVPWFQWFYLREAYPLTEYILHSIPPEMRHPEGTFGLHCFRSFSQVVGGPHTDGFEFGGTYVIERTVDGGVSYLINAAGHQVLNYRLDPGEILLFHEHFPDEDPMFLHGATGLEGKGRRDAIVIQVDAPEDHLAAQMEKDDLGSIW